jgi:hypothetical protein
VHTTIRTGAPTLCNGHLRAGLSPAALGGGCTPALPSSAALGWPTPSNWHAEDSPRRQSGAHFTHFCTSLLLLTPTYYNTDTDVVRSDLFWEVRACVNLRWFYLFSVYEFQIVTRLWTSKCRTVLSERIFGHKLQREKETHT